MPRILPLNERDYPSETRIAFIQHTTLYNARITNMKATLGHNATAFKAYMQWYPLFVELEGVIGARQATLFAWAISEASDSRLCSAHFRKAIVESGEDPSELTLSEEEQELVNFGAEIARHHGAVEDETFKPIGKRYNDSQLVLLTAFAGIMIATSIFNNVNRTQIDTFLSPFKAEQV